MPAPVEWDWWPMLPRRFVDEMPVERGKRFEVEVAGLRDCGEVGATDDEAMLRDEPSDGNEVAERTNEGNPGVNGFVMMSSSGSPISFQTKASKRTLSANL